MSIKLKPLNEQTIVITGASSGIGLATSRSAAAKGAKLVLASRNQEALEKLQQEIRSEGGQAIYTVADVGKQEDVQKIADAALEHYGGFDTWVNNAGVSIYGRLEEVSDEDNRRLFETNFWGVVYGSQIAAVHLKAKGGSIINLGSVLSEEAMPLQGMYSASKHAVKGYTDALRIELENEKAPVSVTLIKPTSINTPYPQHARNYLDEELTLPPPVYAPEEVANAILYAAAHQKRDIYIGGAARFMSSSNKHFPSVMDWITGKFMIDFQKKDKPAEHRDGSLHHAGKDGEVYGNYEGHMMKKSYYTRAALNPAATWTILAFTGAITYWLTKR
jgi:short-subunit dehydrogenase